VEGDWLELNLASGTVKVPQRALGLQAQAYPLFLQEVMDRGGWLPYLKLRAEHSDKTHKMERSHV
jgi:hypothetical protein